MTNSETEPGPLTDRQLRALCGRAGKVPFAFTQWRRGMAAGCEYLATQLREHGQDSRTLHRLLDERWRSGIEHRRRSGVTTRSRFVAGFDAVLDDIAAIVQGDLITIDRYAAAVRSSSYPSSPKAER